IRTDDRPAVPAPVEEGPDLAVTPPRHDKLLAPDPLRTVVTGLRYLGLMGKIDPVVVENPLQLGLEDRFVREHRRVHPVLEDERRVADTLTRCDRHRLVPPRTTQVGLSPVYTIQPARYAAPPRVSTGRTGSTGARQCAWRIRASAGCVAMITMRMMRTSRVRG